MKIICDIALDGNDGAKVVCDDEIFVGETVSMADRNDDGLLLRVAVGVHDGETDDNDDE